MLAKIKGYFNLRYICILLLVFACLWCCYDSVRIDKNRSDCNSAYQQIKSSQELVRRAGAENNSAREAVKRADERAAEAEAINKRVTQQLDGCSELIDAIRADNQRAKQLLDELIGDY